MRIQDPGKGTVASSIMAFTPSKSKKVIRQFGDGDSSQDTFSALFFAQLYFQVSPTICLDAPAAVNLLLSTALRTVFPQRHQQKAVPHPSLNIGLCTLHAQSPALTRLSGTHEIPSTQRYRAVCPHMQHAEVDVSESRYSTLDF